jgi:hypothetical protein
VVHANLAGVKLVKTQYARTYLLGPQPAAMLPVVHGRLDLKCICTQHVTCCMIHVVHTTQWRR